MAAGTYYYVVTAEDAAGNTSAASAQATAVVTSDTAASAVAVTSPAGGATVSGTINVAASASDNVGVVGVQFLLNGANLGVEDTTVPYSVSWNTTTIAKWSTAGRFGNALSFHGTNDRVTVARARTRSI